MLLTASFVRPRKLRGQTLGSHPAKAQMERRSFNWQTCIGLCGILIALISLVFAYRQTNISEKQSHVAVQPRITLTIQDDDARDRRGWYINNNGLGPAYFTNFQIFIDDQPIKSTERGGWTKALSALGVQAGCFGEAWTPSRTSLPAGRDGEEALVRFHNRDPACTGQFDSFLRQASRIKVKIGYQSIYGDQFSVEDAPNMPE